MNGQRFKQRFFFREKKFPLLLLLFGLNTVLKRQNTFSEMNLDIDRVFGLFFSLKYDLLYRLELDGISACFCSSTLN